ncbi:MAG TPA: Txe/YoeB family addiction module toxin [Chitinophagaceae bacterium]|nr:Txe/YoeB family addiction module toxin [Chitinophagaceae bacterium]
MHFEFTEDAREDFEYWLDRDKVIAGKIREILKDISTNPIKGIGKPEPLKFRLKGYWSRRINPEHRLVYKLTGKKGEEEKCLVIMCRHHYD